MKRSSYVMLLTMLAGMLVMSSCGVKRSQAYYDQSTQVLSANYDGSYVLRVQVRARNAAVGFADAKRQAVRDVIFKGAKAASNGISDLKPLVFDMNAQEKHEDYFNAFFEDKGAWNNYCSLQDRRTNTSSFERTNTQMVQTVTVTVDRAGLKRRLQADGIIPTDY